MRKAARARLLLFVLGAVVVLTAVALLAGCSKPQTTETTPPVSPPSHVTPPATKPAETAAKPPQTESKPTEAAKPQTAADPKQMTDLEKKHVPQFVLPGELKAGKALSVMVNVGQVAHPMVAEHYIQWVELYLDGKLVKKVELKPGGEPMATFDVTLTPGAHTLKADINCNVHGLWENTKEITAS